MEDGAEERLEKRRKLNDGAGTRLVTPSENERGEEKCSVLTSSTDSEC